ncbi:hypothetical protein UPYG_G00161260 [Umbra pygmaea]|uniref:C2H2-type domain-containing protein n=1 Tax=Umbra pygmaea TaxID=75934 RepID=A0ABD0WLN3_UMBPY
MEEESICAPLLAESDTENNNNSHDNVASVSDTVINTNITNSSQIEDQGKDKLLKGLLTDNHCQVCDASLLFESQRVAHYEGKKHAQKVRLYLQTKKDEKLSKEPAGFQRGVTVDKDRFCELCSMVFSSPVVARSHYDGKVHAKNLRKQGIYPTTQTKDTSSQRGPDLTSSSQSQASDQGAGMVGANGPPNASDTVDLSDPNKHCRLCAASFNNPYMAQQHYVGRKHQRNQSRQQLLKDLGEDPAQANSFTCPVCTIELNSVEMYQAHMQGNKHQVKEKKVVDLCRSQKKVYDSFADELADYINVQKTRGIAPKTSFGTSKAEGVGAEEWQDDGAVDTSQVDWKNESTLGVPSASRPHLPLAPLPHPATLHPPPLWSPPYQPPPNHFGFQGSTYEHAVWSNPFPRPLPLRPALTGFTGRPKARGRAKAQSSSSSSYTSSSSSSYSSSSDSDSDHRRRERKRRKMRKEKARTLRGEESDERKRRGRKRIRDDEAKARRGTEPDNDAEGGRRRRKRKQQQSRSRSHGTRSRAKRRREEDGEGAAKGERENSAVERGGGEEEAEVYVQAEIQEVAVESQEVKETKAKHRKEKKRSKEKVDTRTEEEKLWDESILGL